jgi:hypothetical protein
MERTFTSEKSTSKIEEDGGSTASTFASENEHKRLQIQQSHSTTIFYYHHHEHANRIPPKQKPKKFDL